MRKKRRTTDFAQAIEDALYDQRLTQVDAAERIGVSPATLGSIMAGHIPTAETIKLIADKLGLDALQLQSLAGHIDAPAGLDPDIAEVVAFMQPMDADSRRLFLRILRAIAAEHQTLG